MKTAGREEGARCAAQACNSGDTLATGDKRARQVKALAARPEDLGFPTPTRWKETTNSYKLSSDLHRQLLLVSHAYTPERRI